MERNIPDILRNIIEHKKLDVARDKEKLSLERLKYISKDLPPTQGFIDVLSRRIKQKHNAIIAEIKRASPSKGILRETFNLDELVLSCQQGGASCLSILTDEMFFYGHSSYIKQARKITSLPILRKDFIIDAYQIYRSRWMRADCILLIASVLNDEKLTEFNELAKSLQLDVLIEVHNAEEVERVLKLKPRIIGINNRNLHDFSEGINNTLELLPLIPQDVLVVSESSFSKKEDIKLMNKNGVYAFLIGAALMRAPDPAQVLKGLL